MAKIEVSPASGSHARLLRRLTRIVKAFNCGMPIGGVLRRITDAAIQNTGVRRGFLILRHDDGYEFAAARDFRRHDVSSPEKRITKTVLRRCLARGRPVVTPHAREDRRVRGNAGLRSSPPHSILCVPLCGRTAILGAIYLEDWFRPGNFGTCEREIAASCSETATPALHGWHRSDRLTKGQSRSRGDTARAGVDPEGAGGTVQKQHGSPRIVGKSRAIQRNLQRLQRAARSDVTVLLVGESGTGKELFAGAIHAESPRRDGPFIPFSCATLPDGLMDAELFGYVQGAFTGATKGHLGLLRAADGGTVFLDEIGDAPLSLQAKLLRFLQNGELRPLGGTESTRVDVRTLAATNKDIEKEVESGRFRQDLYHRLNEVCIELPPLRERKEDIVPLARYFLQLSCKTEGFAQKRFSRRTLQVLRRHNWGGNVRELENAVRRGVILAEGDTIRHHDLGLRPGSSAGDLGIIPLAELEKRMILRALDFTGGDKARTAKMLGISAATIYRKIRVFGLHL